MAIKSWQERVEPQRKALTAAQERMGQCVQRRETFTLLPRPKGSEKEILAEVNRRIVEDHQSAAMLEDAKHGVTEAEAAFEAASKRAKREVVESGVAQDREALQRIVDAATALQKAVRDRVALRQAVSAAAGGPQSLDPMREFHLAQDVVTRLDGVIENQFPMWQDYLSGGR